MAEINEALGRSDSGAQALEDAIVATLAGGRGLITKVVGTHSQARDLQAVVEAFDGGSPITGEVRRALGRSDSFIAALEAAIGAEGGAAWPDLPTPIVLDNFQSTAGWFPTNGSTGITITDGGDTVDLTDVSAASSSTATKHSIAGGASLDPAALGVLALWVEADMDPEWHMAAGFFRLGSGGSGGSGGTYNSTASFGGMVGGAESDYQVGHWFGAGNVSGLSGLPAPGVLGLRTETSQAPGGRVLKMRRALANAAGRPTVLLTFDDNFVHQVNLALPAMQARGFKGTTFTPWDSVGTGGNQMSLADLHTLRDAGWAICLDGTSNDAVVNVKHATVAAAVAELESGRTWLGSNGFNPAHGDFFCWPNGIWRVAPTRTQKTGVGITSGSAVLTMANTSGVAVGDRAVGVGIPRSARVSTISADVSVTLDINATASDAAGRVKFVNDSNPFHTEKLQVPLRAAGFKVGRTTLGGPFYSRYGVGTQGLVLPGHSSTNATQAMLKGYTQAAITQGSTCMIYFHGFADPGVEGSGGLTVPFAAFIPFLDDLKAKYDARQVDVLTVPEWWARDCATPAIPPV